MKKIYILLSIVCFSATMLHAQLDSLKGKAYMRLGFGINLGHSSDDYFKNSQQQFSSVNFDLIVGGFVTNTFGLGFRLNYIGSNNVNSSAYPYLAYYVVNEQFKTLKIGLEFRKLKKISEKFYLHYAPSLSYGTGYSQLLLNGIEPPYSVIDVDNRYKMFFFEMNAELHYAFRNHRSIYFRYGNIEFATVKKNITNYSQGIDYGPNSTNDGNFSYKGKQTSFKFDFSPATIQLGFMLYF